MKLKHFAIGALALACASSANADVHVMFGWSGDRGTQSLNLTGSFGTQSIQAQATGWWGSDGFHDADNPNYAAGEEHERIYNDYFVFDLSGVSGTITGASLTLFNPVYASTKYQHLTFELHDVHTPLSDLTASGNNRYDIYADLGSGTVYGSQVVGFEDNESDIVIALNADAVTALQGAAGGRIALGGSIPAIPEPETYALVGIGAAMVAVARRRATRSSRA